MAVVAVEIPQELVVVELEVEEMVEQEQQEVMELATLVVAAVELVILEVIQELLVMVDKVALV